MCIRDRSSYYAIQIEPEYLGVPVSLYLDQLVGKLIVGQQSGVTGRVSSYITNEESERGNYTLYIDYFESATTDAATQTFFDDEILLTTENITFATTFIGANDCLLYTSPSPRDLSTSRMPSSA